MMELISAVNKFRSALGKNKTRFSTPWGNGKVFAFLGLAILLPTLIHAATFTVSKDGRGAFTTVQAAVTKAGKGDVVEILDAAIYPEQVTIDSNKNGLTIRSSNPIALAKPTIKYQDVTHQNPKTCADALDQSKIDFDQNGALRLLWARNITIDGIGVDGGGASPFSWPGVWGDGISCTAGQKYPLFHGNGGIVLFLSGNVTIKNCDISNAFNGIAVKDRNQGGVFAIFNPADLEKFNIVPLSGFGKTGNHVIEKNRIHNNSWGFFFESTWDLGSTVRYNLLYENHHATTAVATAVKAMPDGENQPGGAFFFKDVMLTPISIYNNTFWHNYTLFSGGYRPGAQHLIFNNIFAEPNEYYSKGVFNNPFVVLDPFFLNRMKYSIYAAQSDPPKLDSRNIQAQQRDEALNKQIVKDTLVSFYQSVRIMNGMGNPVQEAFPVNITLQMSTGPVVITQTLTGANLPGALIGASATDPFPVGSGVRWFEIKFKSTDPANPDFLTPNWDDPTVKKYVMNGGWPEAGIYNSDGLVADVGAIPSTSRHADNVIIRPLAPVVINGTTATLSFDLTGLQGSLQSPKIKYIRFVKNIPVNLNGFGGAKTLIVPDPVTVTPASSSLKMGPNTITITGIPALDETQSFAFFEIIAEGIGADGKAVTTNVGFLPYRKLDYKFVVEIFNVSGTKITSAKAGEAVKLVITPQKLDGTPFLNIITPVEINLNSGADLLVPTTPPTKLALTSVDGPTTQPVLFTKVPPGGLEYVTVSGIWKNGSNTLPFYGVSDGIKILPGDAEKLIFQDPPSKILSPGSAPVIDPGQTYLVKVEARDKFDNKINTPVLITIKGNQPTIGDIDGPTTATTDSTGVATFKAKVTNGELNQTFELEASIAGKTPDKADLKVGKPRDRLWVLYADTKINDPAVELRGTAGERLPVTIRAGHDANTKLITRVTEFKVDVTKGLTVYASATDTVSMSTFTLVAGELVIWVQGQVMVDNGFITLTPTIDNTILPGNRGKIFFTFTPTNIVSSSIHADNGFGKADRLEVHFKDDLKATPDSISISWPIKGSTTQVVRSGISIDPADKKHVTVHLAMPFPGGITTSPTGKAPGTAYTFDPATPDIGVQAMDFQAADSIGALLDSATVQDRTEAADDTLIVAFSEAIVSGSLNGASLVLIKKGGSAPVTLTVLTSTSFSKGGFRIAVKDLGAQAPKEGDSLKINPLGPLTDAFGNHSNAFNRPVALKLKIVPKPPILLVKMDRPYQKVDAASQHPDFILFSSNPDSTWNPFQYSNYNKQSGLTSTCDAGTCGGPIRGGGEGSLDLPGVTVETNRAAKYSVTIFNNFGVFINGFNGQITNAQLGLDERGLPAVGVTPLISRGANGNFRLKITWNSLAYDQSRAATGAYLIRVVVVGKGETEEGKPISLSTSRVIRFGMLRK